MVEIDSKNPELDRYTIEAIVDHLKNSGAPITYGELAEKVGALRGETMSPDGFAHALGRIQRYCKGLGLPSLPALVVNRETSLPGPGFMECYADIAPNTADIGARVIVKGEQACCRECADWQALLDL